MSDSFHATQREVHVALRRERLPVLAFDREERAALPRRAAAGINYTQVTAGAPEPIKSRLGRNIFLSAFPYPQWVRGTGNRTWLEYRLVEVGSDRWQITVCPDLGGRILGLADRQLGRELLWQPSALQLAPIGLPGAWLLGGIEFNAFRFGHCVHGMMAVRTERVQLAGGQTGLRWGAVDELLECEWSVVLTPLGDGVAVQVTLQNHSNWPQPGYWWTNIAIPSKLGTRLFYHPGPVLHHGCDMGMLYEQWPQLNGSDWQYWQNHSGIISAYWPEYGSDVFGYAPPGEGWAMAHYADRRLCRGRKLWSVGSGHDADVWMDRVGNPSAESYCEIQSGRLPTQIEADLLAPHSRLTWVEVFTTVACPADADAVGGFAEFERAATSSLHHTSEGFWRVTQAEVLVEEDPRLALSRKVVLSPGALDESEIRQATRQGWVGGRPWVRVLETSPADEWRDLALGAARLDLNDKSGAAALLAPLAQRDDECAGFASLLLGNREYERGQREAATAHFERAVARLSENLDARRLLHQVLLETNHISLARDLWPTSPGSASSDVASDVPSVKQPAGLTVALAASDAAHVSADLMREAFGVRRIPPLSTCHSVGMPRTPNASRVRLALMDAARFARAQIAFLERRWQDAREELERPMPCIAEGAAGPWLLRKEIELAEALEQYSAGRYEEAQNRLLEGCRFMPQFGVGRYETTGNVDLMFYRWFLADRARARYQAEALASHILRFRPYAGSMEAAYVLRLAVALGDPSVGPRSAALAAWGAEAEPVWRELLPLRYAVRQGTPAAWEPLLNHLLYRYRARFESDLARTLIRPL